MRCLVLAGLIACATGPGKNEVVGKIGRSQGWKARVSAATFDGNLTTVALGPRVSIVIASCYAHAHQKVGDHDHVQIRLDGKPAAEGQLDITDCTTSHVVASMWAKFADGTRLEASIDTALARR
jgi:hypothetical protein